MPESVRLKGKLTIIPMRGWRRSMRWPETGLNFVATSQNIRDFDAVVGYAMIGLGCQSSGFSHGLDTPYPFRSLTFKGIAASRLEKDLKALNLPGLRFSQMPVANARGRAAIGVRFEVTDWETWNPTELSFHLMRLACQYTRKNPFAKLNATDADLFNKHTGSTAWWTDLKHYGSKVDVEKWLRAWQTEADLYKTRSQQYWMDYSK